MIITSSTNVFAVDNNSWTDATKTSQGQSEKWSEWCDKWEKIKNSPTQMQQKDSKAIKQQQQI